MSESIKEQLAKLASSGKLQPKKIEKSSSPAAAPSKKSEKAKSAESATAEAQPELDVRWTAKATSFITACFKESNLIPTFGSTREPEFNQKLSNIEATVTKVHSKISREQKTNRKRELTEARRACETVLNYVKTVSEAAAVNDVRVDDFEGINKKLNAQLREVNAALEKVKASTVPVPKVDKALQSIESTNMTRYKIFQRELEVALRDNADKTLIIVDLPIVPILSGGCTTQDLLNQHIPAEPMGGYSALLKQRIIGLNPAKLEEQNFAKEDYIKQVVERLNQRCNQNYVLVSDKPVADRKYKTYFYWIMPSAVLDALMCAGGKQVSVDGWGFAF